MINLIDEIKKLKNDSNSKEYNKAVDDVLNLYINLFKPCRIVHEKSGLYFNGFSDSQYNQGKNTLSITNFSKINLGNRSDEEILAAVFHGHVMERNGIKFVYNNIVNAGSEINKILSKYYDELKFLPVDDFIVEKNF
ncbi:MAG: hypothetical protein H7250_11105 [Flavobacterium sp.]|nr:hypothetical protein [Flavobacterium sp.]